MKSDLPVNGIDMHRSKREKDRSDSENSMNLNTAISWTFGSIYEQYTYLIATIQANRTSAIK